jgi:hypothetical protein
VTETVTRYVPPKNPWDAPPIDDAEVLAIKALVLGKASAFQQQLALKVIVVKFAATYDMTFRPGGEDGARASTFAAGKAFVGQRIMEATERPMKTKVTGAKDANTSAQRAEPNGGQAALRKHPKPQAQRTKPSSGE